MPEAVTGFFFKLEVVTGPGPPAEIIIIINNKEVSLRFFLLVFKFLCST